MHHRGEPSPRCKGITSVVAILFLAIFLAMAVSFSSVSNMNSLQAANFRAVSKAQIAADIGLSLMTRRLENSRAAACYRGQALLAVLGLPPIQAQVTNRWEAMRNWDSHAQNASWLWTVLALGLCALLIVAILVAFVHRRPVRRRARKSFRAQARSHGLSGAEQTVLDHIAVRAGLKDAGAIFTMENAVDEGAKELLTQEFTGASPLGTQKHMEAAVASVCQKLGFRSPLPSQLMSVFGTRHLPQGARLLVIGEDGIVRLAATVTGADPECLNLVADAELNLTPPLHVLLRYGSQGLAREFDCELVSCQDRQFRVRHAPVIRTVNLRRYVRVPIDQEALVAECAFFRDTCDMGIPSFVQARLQEIAGPGLLLHMPTRGTLPARLLVIARMADRTVVQGAAAVRRVTRLDGERSSVAVEFLDLSPQELAEMVRQTNLASHRQPGGGSTASPRPMREAGSTVQEESTGPARRTACSPA
jgi:hypothetical protein